MDIKANRLANLRRLKSEFGTLVAIGRATGVSVAYLSQLLAGTTLPSGAERGVGDRLARRLEKGCGKPRGWMDEPPGNHHGRRTSDRRKPDKPAVGVHQDLDDLFGAYRQGSAGKRRALALLAQLPESEITAVLMLLESISAKYYPPKD